MPIVLNPNFARLMALRSSQPKYIGSTPARSGYLGLEIGKAVIPDAALAKLEIKDVLEYRSKSADAHKAWSDEVEKYAAKLDDIEPEKLPDAAKKLIATEVTPKLQEYQNEMKSVRDRMFGDILKGVTDWKLPVLTAGMATGVGVTEAITTFAGAALGKTAGPIVDYVVSKRKIKRSNAISYLVGLSKE